MQQLLPVLCSDTKIEPATPKHRIEESYWCEIPSGIMHPVALKITAGYIGSPDKKNAAEENSTLMNHDLFISAS